MCGIVGVIRKDFDVVETSLEKLSQLEYRGYDSFGVAFVEKSGNISCEKRVGAVSESLGLLSCRKKESRLTIAHTRWATHGEVSEKNAHPHMSSKGAVWLVHNGVIENYSELKDTLILEGKLFSSDTDSEVIANLLEHFVDNGRSPRSALDDALERLEGEFAICAVFSSDPQSLYCVSRKSSLVFNASREVTIIASDPLALTPEFSSFKIIPDDTVLKFSYSEGSVRPHWAAAFWANGFEEREIEKAPGELGIGQFPDYMSKEMSEIPNAIRSADRDMSFIEPLLDSKKVAYFVGCGSALYAAQIGAYFLAKSGLHSLIHVPVSADEVLNSISPKLFDSSVVFAVSQSGETFDTLNATRNASLYGACIIGISNASTSALIRESDIPVVQNAGREICVLSTKSIVSQVALFARMFSRTTNLGTWADAWEETFSDSRFNDSLNKIADIGKEKDHWFFIGRDELRVVAQESALKLKEVTYIHAEGMGAGFFKHGTLSLIDDRFLTVVHLPSPRTQAHEFALTLANAQEIAARGGILVAIGCGVTLTDEIENLFAAIVNLPDIDVYANTALQLGVGQRIAYKIAKLLGRNVDRPRSLAKSVTVR